MRGFGTNKTDNDKGYKLDRYFWLGLTLFTIVVSYCIYELFTGWSPIGWGLACYTINIAMWCNYITIQQQIAERYCYLANVGMMYTLAYLALGNPIMIGIILTAYIVRNYYSMDTYLNFQLQAYDDLVNQIGDFYADFFVFHSPFAKMPVKLVQNIIEKRWSKNINNLLSYTRNDLTTSLFKKLDSVMQNVSVLPEYVYLRLKEKGFTSDSLEKLSNWVVSNVKGQVLPHLRVPMHFGNMYNASVWAQVCYILETHANDFDTVYFGSYGSGATCISGLLKIQPTYQPIVSNGPKVNDFIQNKTQASIDDYEQWKKGEVMPDIVLGKIIAHEGNDDRGFVLHFCDEGCIIPNFKGLDYCPKGHSGFHTRFFPLYAVLESDNLIHTTQFDTRVLKEGLVRVAHNINKNNILEYEMRRVGPTDDKNPSYTAIGLLNWVPMYIPVKQVF